MSLFDHLIAGDLPASFVHQDDRCVAFMDISPINRGHVLVVPRASVATLIDLSPDDLAHLWRVAVQVGAAQRAALGSQAQHFLVNDGKAASQSVPHVHIHVIPRHGGDALATVSRMIWHVGGLLMKRRPKENRRAELDAVAAAIAAHMGEVTS